MTIVAGLISNLYSTYLRHVVCVSSLVKRLWTARLNVLVAHTKERRSKQAGGVLGRSRECEASRAERRTKSMSSVRELVRIFSCTALFSNLAHLNGFSVRSM